MKEERDNQKFPGNVLFKNIKSYIQIHDHNFCVHDLMLHFHDQPCHIVFFFLHQLKWQLHYLQLIIKYNKIKTILLLKS